VEALFEIQISYQYWYVKKKEIQRETRRVYSKMFPPPGDTK